MALFHQTMNTYHVGQDIIIRFPLLAWIINRLSIEGVSFNDPLSTKNDWLSHVFLSKFSGRARPTRTSTRCARPLRAAMAALAAAATAMGVMAAAAEAVVAVAGADQRG